MTAEHDRCEPAYPAAEVARLRLQLASLRGAALAHVKALNEVGGIGHSDPDTERQLNQTLHVLLDAVRASLETHGA